MKNNIERLPNGEVRVTQEVERCVMCNKPSKYTKDIPIDKRDCYIQGAGQLCDECDKELVTWNNLF